MSGFPKFDSVDMLPMGIIGASVLTIGAAIWTLRKKPVKTAVGRLYDGTYDGVSTDTFFVFKKKPSNLLSVDHSDISPN